MTRHEQECCVAGLRFVPTSLSTRTSINNMDAILSCKFWTSCNVAGCVEISSGTDVRISLVLMLNQNDGCLGSGDFTRCHSATSIDVGTFLHSELAMVGLLETNVD